MKIKIKGDKNTISVKTRPEVDEDFVERWADEIYLSIMYNKAHLEIAKAMLNEAGVRVKESGEGE